MLRAICLLLLLAGSVHGQTPLNQTQVMELLQLPSPPQHTAADTIRAIHVLFTNRRLTSGIMFGATGFAMVGGAVLAKEDSPQYRSILSGINGASMAFMVAAPLFAFGVYQAATYSKAEEQKVMNNFTYKHVLPRKIKKKLRESLFMPPAVSLSH